MTTVAFRCGAAACQHLAIAVAALLLALWCFDGRHRCYISTCLLGVATGGATLVRGILPYVAYYRWPSSSFHISCFHCLPSSLIYPHVVRHEGFVKSSFQ